jgi:hypothetical protein
MKKLVTICVVLSFLGISNAQALTVVVPANPLWTDTLLSLTNGDIVTITASGSWAWDSTHWSGPDGDQGSPADGDEFLVGSVNKGSLLAFVGSDPYQSHWGDGSFFPQTSGYWNIGSSAQFTSDKTGELWLGFNDDAVSKNIYDNGGSVTALVIPEPATICLLGLGALGLLRKRRT